MDAKEEQPPPVEANGETPAVETNGLSAMDAISRETVDLVLLFSYCSPSLVFETSLPSLVIMDEFSNSNESIAGAHPRGGGLRASQMYQRGSNQ